MRNIFAVILCLAAFVLPTQAASDAAPSALQRGTQELGVWAGYSPSNPTLIGTTTDRQFFEFNVQYSRVLLSRQGWALKYLGELVPVAIISQPRQNAAFADIAGSKRNIYGGGISPSACRSISAAPTACSPS